MQVTNQVVGEGTKRNRYDVTVLVNGLPLVHIELKKRGVNLHEAFNQIHRYSKESFNSDNSLYKYVQIEHTQDILPIPQSKIKIIMNLPVNGRTQKIKLFMIWKILQKHFLKSVLSLKFLQSIAYLMLIIHC